MPFKLLSKLFGMRDGKNIPVADVVKLKRSDDARAPATWGQDYAEQSGMYANQHQFEGHCWELGEDAMCATFEKVGKQ